MYVLGECVIYIRGVVYHSTADPIQMQLNSASDKATLQKSIFPYLSCDTHQHKN